MSMLMSMPVSGDRQGMRWPTYNGPAGPCCADAALLCTALHCAALYCTALQSYARWLPQSRLRSWVHCCKDQHLHSRLA